MMGRRGVSVVEALLGVLLGFLVLGLGVALLARQRAAVARLTARGEALQTLRVTRYVLEAELRVGIPGRDWVVAGGDSVPLRSFRGVGIGCAALGPTTVAVFYSGIRLPRPEKDSVLILGADGDWVAHGLVSDAPAPGVCNGTGEVPQAWSLADTLRDAALLLRVFERGSYHLADGAFRYRRGRSGRQPLTPAVLDDGSQALMGLPDGGVALELVPRGVGGPWAGFRRGRVAWGARR